MGRYFLDAFIHLSGCKRIFSYFSGNVLLPGWLAGWMAAKWLSVAFYTRFGQTTPGGTVWEGEVNMPSVVEGRIFC